MDTNETGVAQSQYLSFYLAGEEYAINILKVKEIIEYRTLTRMPSVPECVRGVINLRGRVVPVVDLAVRFGLPASEVTGRSCIVMVEAAPDGEPTMMGIMVDAVSQVLDLAPHHVQPPPSLGTRIRAAYLDGMGEAGRKFVMLLNVDRVLAIGGLAGDEPALAGVSDGDDVERGPAAPSWSATMEA